MDIYDFMAWSVGHRPQYQITKMYPKIVSELYIVWVVPLSQLYIYWIKIQPWANIGHKVGGCETWIAENIMKTSHVAPAQPSYKHEW